MVNFNAVETLMETSLKLIVWEQEKSIYATLFNQAMGSFRCVSNTRLVINYVVEVVSGLMSNPKYLT